MTFLLALGSGVLVGIPFLLPYSWPLILIGMVPLLIALKKSHSRVRAFLVGFLCALAMCGFAFYPVYWAPLPLEWMGVTSYLQYLYAFAIWFLSAVVFALPLGAWALLVRTYGTNSWRDFLMFPSAWVIGEFLGALIYSFCTYASQVLLGAHFSLSFLGNVLADDIVLRQLAVFGGVYALSAFVIIANLFFFRAWEERIRRRVAIRIFSASLSLWALGALAFVVIPVPEGTLRIAAITTQVPPGLNVPADVYAGYLATGRELYERAVRSDADIVLFPEGSRYLVPTDQDGMPVGIENSGRAPAILISGREYANDAMRSRMEYYDFSAKKVGYTYKSLLVPIGEYMPGFLQRIGVALGVDEVLSRISAERRYVSGQPASLQLLAGMHIGALFCNETMSPELYRTLAKNGAEVFMNASSQDWFHESRALDRQLLRAARIRAAESHRPYVQSGNLSPSYALDAFGTLIDATEWDEADVLVADIRPSSMPTPYSLVGSYVLLVAFAACVFAITRRR
jgi:apolipoprotein N-acyltransferase